jgi:hypothetical protein
MYNLFENEYINFLKKKVLTKMSATLFCCSMSRIGVVYSNHLKRFSR